MSGRAILRLGAVAGALAACCACLDAAPPWSNLISFNSVEADPHKVYVLSDSQGPWLVMACTFSGKGAEKQANDLVLELRERYKLPAYVHRHEIDPGEAVGRGTYDRYGNLRRWEYQKYKDSKDRDRARHPELAELAVLVGNYQSIDDPTAQETLRKIKFAQPKCLEIKDGQPTHQTLTGWLLIQKEIYEKIGSDKQNFGPMSHAFVTRNPLLPEEYFVTRGGVDTDVIALNRGVPYDLLDCPGKFTVQVATFKGKVIIKQEEIHDIEEGREAMGGELAAAARKADDLTRALRVKGYEAYQFHDRYASIVTVGSFDSVGTPRPDGKTEINPTILRIMKFFGPDKEKSREIQDAWKSQGLNRQVMPASVRTFIGIPFDMQPMPVLVPKRPISTPLQSSE